MMNMAEAAQPRPPNVDEMLQGLRQYLETENIEAVDTSLFGDLFEKADVKDSFKQPTGSRKTRVTAISVVDDFQKVCLELNTRCNAADSRYAWRKA